MTLRARRLLGGLGLWAAVAGVGAPACSVGSGNGQVTGELFILRCDENGQDMGAPNAPVPFDLQPTFFAGEPIDDPISSGTPTNRLLIRIARTGNRPEINDNLYFEVQNVHDVAACVRGQVAAGVPELDAAWCARSPAALDGGTDVGADAGWPSADDPVITIDPFTTVRAYLAVMATCDAANVSGVATGSSWIRFEHFGSAKMSGVAPEEREPVPDDFKMEWGDRLRATFHVELEDLRRVTAEQENQPLEPPQIGGVLDGYFDFDLERGRSAQPFP